MPHSRSIENLAKRTISGGKRFPSRERKAYELDRYAVETSVGNEKTNIKNVRGNNFKIALRKTSFANVLDLQQNKIVKSKILKTVKNPAKRDYERRGVITKGAIIETELGLAKVTSRPGQHGIVNAVSIK